MKRVLDERVDYEKQVLRNEILDVNDRAGYKYDAFEAQFANLGRELQGVSTTFEKSFDDQQYRMFLFELGQNDLFGYFVFILSLTDQGPC